MFLRFQAPGFRRTCIHMYIYIQTYIYIYVYIWPFVFFAGVLGAMGQGKGSFYLNPKSS